MRQYALAAALALAGTLGLAACSNGGQQADQQQQAATQEVTKPSNPDDTAAWGKYLSQVLSKNLQGMTAQRPFPYLVNAGDSDEAKAERQRQLDSVSDVFARGVTPGNLIAFGGPSSKDTADLVVTALQNAQEGTLKGVIILFIGDQADEARVAAAVKPTGAKFRFVAM